LSAGVGNKTLVVSFTMMSGIKHPNGSTNNKYRAYIFKWINDYLITFKDLEEDTIKLRLEHNSYSMNTAYYQDSIVCYE
jgi:hypothetical protein